MLWLRVAFEMRAPNQTPKERPSFRLERSPVHTCEVVRERVLGLYNVPGPRLLEGPRVAPHPHVPLPLLFALEHSAVLERPRLPRRLFREAVVLRDRLLGLDRGGVALREPCRLEHPHLPSKVRVPLLRGRVTRPARRAQGLLAALGRPAGQRGLLPREPEQLLFVRPRLRPPRLQPVQLGVHRHLFRSLERPAVEPAARLGGLHGGLEFG
mmetsp:Transcript_58443/g.117348  ORF Transcript_58443/g.117348 Transcript_58443/m.117348 type:complete len:211 (+) Transcript_58443:140-772(+)